MNNPTDTNKKATFETKFPKSDWLRSHWTYRSEVDAASAAADFMICCLQNGVAVQVRLVYLDYDKAGLVKAPSEALSDLSAKQMDKMEESLGESLGDILNKAKPKSFLTP
jgi:hypothetical protein